MELIKRLIEHYGNITQAAKALGVSRQHFQSWQAQGFIPFKRGAEIELKSEGLVKAAEVWEAAGKKIS